MKKVPTKNKVKTPKVLVAIANYGEKNRMFLDRLVWEYKSMTKYNVDLVVLSEKPKYLGCHIEVVVGLPAKDPWSLPFSYKKLFVQRKDDYDIYIYSEDDTLVTQTNIDAFIDESRKMSIEEVPGFMRYEIGPDGERYYSSMHSHYHWDINTLKRNGDSIYAYYTNDHSACFILTCAQLRLAIESNGFMLPPRKDKYDMLVTAATEPYTVCGMKKMLCITRINEFCLHHLPNVYCGKLGLDELSAIREIQKLESYVDTPKHNLPKPLIIATPLRDDDRWNKKYYDRKRVDIIKSIPKTASRILSIGCGCGTTEAALIADGKNVWGIPLDEIISVIAENKGVLMLPSNFELATDLIKNTKFDCIILMDILHEIIDPVLVLRKSLDLLTSDGTIIVSSPNYNYYGLIRNRMTCMYNNYYSDKYQKNIHTRKTTMLSLAKMMHDSGLVKTFVNGNKCQSVADLFEYVVDRIKNLIGKDIVLSGRAR